MQTCTFCRRTFQKTEHLVRHQRSHTGERPFTCSKCGRQYSRKDVLLRHLRLHRRQETDSVSEQQRGQGSLSVDGGESLLEQRPHSETRLSGATFVSGDPQIVCPALLSGSNGSQMEMSATTAQPNDVAQWSRGLHGSESSSQTAPSFSGLSREVEKRQQRQREKPILASTVPDEALAGVTRTEPPGGVSYTEYGSNMMQPQIDMTDSPHTADEHISTDFLDFLSPDALLFNFEYPSGRNSPKNHLNLQPSDRASTIPAERFSQVARLWPIRTAESSACTVQSSLWSEVIDFPGDNICTDPSSSKSSPSLSVGDQDESKWGLDEDKRLHLMQECMTSDFDGTIGDRPAESSFPTTRLLNIGLDSAFRQPHSVLVFIHRTTFSARSTSNSILFPLCLLGLATLESREAKEYTLAYLPTATEKCATQLAQCSSQPGNYLELIHKLISATLLLATWSMIPINSLREETLVQMLHRQAMLRVQSIGLLLSRQPRCSLIFEELLKRIQANNLSQTNDISLDDSLWKSWARVESVKRLVSVLAVLDAWWSHSISTKPQLSSNCMGLEMPCSSNLFRCKSASTWRRLIHEDSRIFNNPALVQNDPLLVQLPKLSDPSPISVVGILSTVWIRINEICFRMPVYASPQNRSSVIDQKILAFEEQGKQLGYMLYEIHAKYIAASQLKNPNCLVLWHFLNLHLHCQVSIFELAAGRSGADSARAALQSIATWCQTPQARRACLHAAGVYTAMSRLRIKDGTMLHSETSLFTAALVLGLYVFMMQPATDSQSSDFGAGSNGNQLIEPYEFLHNVDWSLLRGNEFGLDAPSFLQSSTPARANIDKPSRAVRQFITNGGPVSFSGFICTGGYHSAKMVLHEFASLLEDIGKWKAKRYCYILRIMSDTLLDIDER